MEVGELKRLMVYQQKNAVLGRKQRLETGFGHR
jgi:hypothetical protein